jgi:ABC-type transport system involved in multi-copper enzyme maturation permease subunit
MFWRILSIENTKVIKRRMLWIELGLLALLLIIILTVVYAQYQSNKGQSQETGIGPHGGVTLVAMRETVTWPKTLWFSLSFAEGSSLGGLLLIILVGAVTSNEYTWRTMHLWLSRGLPRPSFLGAKFVSLLLPLILIVLTPLVVGGALTSIFSLEINHSLNLSQLNFFELFMSAVRTAYTLLPFAALAFLLAILTRSTAAAIGIGIAYYLLVENVAASIFTLVGGIMKQIVVYLPGSMAKGLLALNLAERGGFQIGGGEAAGVTHLDPVPATIGLALWTMLFIGLALWIFQRQDLTE